MFTVEQIKEIEYKLSLRSRKDTQFPDAQSPITGKETIAFVQDGKNVKWSIDKFIDNLVLFGMADFVNITDKYGVKNVTLGQALTKIQEDSRKIGQVICFLGVDNTWDFYQFNGNKLEDYTDEKHWKKLLPIQFKGLFEGEDNLKKYHSNPIVGNYAYVRKENPQGYFLYQCLENGKWQNMGDIISLIADLQLEGDISISNGGTWVIGGIDTGISIYPKNIYWEQITDRPITWEDLKKIMGGNDVFADKNHTHTLDQFKDLQTLLDSINIQLSDKASKNHNHNSLYAIKNHNHKGTYATIDIDSAVRNMVDSDGNPLFNKDGIVIPQTSGGGEGGGGGTDIDIIKTGDNTPASNSNVFSSLKSLMTFLRKDTEDSTKFKIKFLDGLDIGDYIDSIHHGKGASIDKDGNAQFESIEVRSYLKVLELIYNRLNAIEGDQVFTESGTIDKVEKISDDSDLLHLRKRWDGDFNAFQVNDVIRGVVNNLDSSGEYYTSWARVTEVDRTNNQIKVLYYPDTEVPSKYNFKLEDSTIIHRWGNATKQERQSTWYISSDEGRIVFLQNVTKPILEDHNYSSFWGKPVPLKIFDGKPINYNQPYVYMKGLLVQDLIRVDYNGKPIVSSINAGPWIKDGVYYNGSQPPYIQHDVFHKGVLWRCIVNEPTQEPSFESSQWAALSDLANYTIEVYTDAPMFYRPNTSFSYDLYAKVSHGKEDITSKIRDIDWEWVRNSGDPRLDAVWNQQHINATNKITITHEDMGNPDSGTTVFSCNVSIFDNGNWFNIKKEIQS